jgi:pimeloyl-ACP methyl ester carboxylesterase
VPFARRRALKTRRPVQQPWEDTSVSGELSVHGLNIAYERAGSEPPVALAHGFVGDARSTWGSQIDALADEFTVVAWDAPGAGRSPDPPKGFGMDDYADCFAAVLRALGLERAHLVGLSFGGALVLATFHRHRDLASSLVLVSGYAGWRGSLGADDAEQRRAQSLQVSGLPPDEFAAAMVPSMFSSSAEGELVAAFIDSVRAVRPGGFRAMASASFDDQSHVLPEVDVPTLLLYSDHDVRAPVAIGEAIHAVVRGSELVVLPGPGHVSSVEAPDDVTRELRRFLHSVERPFVV